MRRFPAACVACVVSCLLLPLAPAAKESDLASRHEAQGAAKLALADTRLDDEQMSAAYADMEGFVASWALGIQKMSLDAVSEIDLEELVESRVLDKLQDRGIALTQQRAIVDALVLRARAIRDEHAKTMDAMRTIKQTLEDTEKDDPFGTALLRRLVEFVPEASWDVLVPGVDPQVRRPASEVVEEGLGSLLDEGDFSDKEREALVAAVGRWLEAKATLDLEGRATR